MKDYLNTKDAQQVAAKYADILHKSRPVSEESLCKHPRMTLENRAKIFSPFAALRGYEQKIETEGLKMQRVEKQIMSEEETEKLSQKLAQITKGMDISAICFRADATEPGRNPIGFYQEVHGRVERIDPIKQTIRIGTNVIHFEDVLDVAGEMIISQTE